MRLSIILIFLLGISFVSAATQEITLFEDQSFEFRGKNITLMTIGEDNKALFCVNGVRYVGEEDFEITRNSFEIDVTNVRSNNVEISFRVTCDGQECICTDECDNSACYGISEEPLELPDNEEESEDVGDIEILPLNEPEISEINQEIKENGFFTIYSIIFFALILILIVLVLVFFIKKKE
ncbi:hypothetical protein K8R47_02045 [archaeon]|nr:hypothetical protein [archaeon]